jgi:hypothetical protein
MALGSFVFSEHEKHRYWLSRSDKIILKYKFSNWWRRESRNMKDSSDKQNWGFYHVFVLFSWFMLLGGVFTYTSLAYVNGPIKINWLLTFLILAIWNLFTIAIYLYMGKILRDLGFFNQKQSYLWAGFVSLFWIGLMDYVVIERLLSYARPNAFPIDGKIIYLNGFQEALLIVPLFSIPWLFEAFITWLLLHKQIQIRLLHCLAQWTIIVAAIFVISGIFHVSLLTLGLILVGIGVFHSKIFQYLLQQQDISFQKANYLQKG